VTLRPNGDIVFVYIEVQSVLSVAALYDHEPVAGISGKLQCHTVYFNRILVEIVTRIMLVKMEPEPQYTAAPALSAPVPIVSCST
jgi:hypothetical protein